MLYLLPSLLEALKAVDKLVPPNRAEVILVLIVKVDFAKRAPRRRLADFVTIEGLREAVEILAVDGKRV